MLRRPPSRPTRSTWLPPWLTHAPQEMFLGQLAAMLERSRLTAAPQGPAPTRRPAQQPEEVQEGGSGEGWRLAITRLQAMSAASKALPYTLTASQVTHRIAAAGFSCLGQTPGHFRPVWSRCLATSFGLSFPPPISLPTVATCSTATPLLQPPALSPVTHIALVTGAAGDPVRPGGAWRHDAPAAGAR
jgi:hypothetical protein